MSGQADLTVINRLGEKYIYPSFISETSSTQDSNAICLALFRAVLTERWCFVQFPERFFESSFP
jgi:hypothetical protein